MEKCRKFQLVVIGGGSAGHAAAMAAAEAEVSTALVEQSPVLGGVCILRGGFSGSPSAEGGGGSSGDEVLKAFGRRRVQKSRWVCNLQPGGEVRGR